MDRPMTSRQSDQPSKRGIPRVSDCGGFGAGRPIKNEPGLKSILNTSNLGDRPTVKSTAPSNSRPIWETSSLMDRKSLSKRVLEWLYREE